MDINRPRDGTTVGIQALQLAIVTKNPTIISILPNAGVPLNHEFPTPQDYSVYFAKRFSSPWIVGFLIALGGEDREVDPDHVPEDWFPEENPSD